ncbi:MAG: amidohydrolase family protein [Acidobacteria bacterium]|nr:amidohydrolase family protein [Acidobacteriota bacterium]
MQTRWGDLAVSDAHVHFFSHGFFRLLAQQKPGLTLEAMGDALGWEMPPEDPARLANRWAAELDARGVARAALIASLPGDESSVSAAVAACPGRFHGFFMVNPAVEGAGERACAALNSGPLRVPCLFPVMHRYSLENPLVRAFLEAVAQTPSPVIFVHCGVLTVGVRKKLDLPSPFDMRFSNPIDLHSVALRYPNVRFIVPHFGAGFFREALMLADLCPNVYLDTSSSNSWTRYLEGEWTLAQVFRRALDVAGPGRLLFGTDSSFFPRGWQSGIFEQQTTALHQIGVSVQDASRILGENLEQLLSR